MRARRRHNFGASALQWWRENDRGFQAPAAMNASRLVIDLPLDLHHAAGALEFLQVRGSSSARQELTGTIATPYLYRCRPSNVIGAQLALDWSTA